MQATADIEWEICLVSMFGAAFTTIAVVNILLSKRAAATENGQSLYFGNTELGRELIVLTIQLVFVYVGATSLIEGNSILPPDGLWYRRAVLIASILLSMATAWTQIRNHAQRTLWMLGFAKRNQAVKP